MGDETKESGEGVVKYCSVPNCVHVQVQEGLRKGGRDRRVTHVTAVEHTVEDALLPWW